MASHFPAIMYYNLNIVFLFGFYFSTDRLRYEYNVLVLESEINVLKKNLEKARHCIHQNTEKIFSLMLSEISLDFELERSHAEIERLRPAATQIRAEKIIEIIKEYEDRIKAEEKKFEEEEKRKLSNEELLEIDDLIQRDYGLDKFSSMEMKTRVDLKDKLIGNHFKLKAAIARLDKTVGTNLRLESCVRQLRSLCELQLKKAAGLLPDLTVFPLCDPQPSRLTREIQAESNEMPQAKKLCSQIGVPSQRANESSQSKGPQRDRKKNKRIATKPDKDINCIIPKRLLRSNAKYRTLKQ